MKDENLQSFTGLPLISKNLLTLHILLSIMTTLISQEKIIKNMYYICSKDKNLVIHFFIFLPSTFKMHFAFHY